MTDSARCPALLLAAVLGGCGPFRVPPPANSAVRLGRVPASQRSIDCEGLIVTDRDAAIQRRTGAETKPAFVV